MAAVHEAAQQSKPFDLLERIGPLTEGIAPGIREAVTTLPDTQGVLRQPGVALDSRDAEGDRRLRRTVVHGLTRSTQEHRGFTGLTVGFVLDKSLTVSRCGRIIGRYA